MSNNPRWKSTAFRKRIRARFKATDSPCYLCGKPIRYDVPSCPAEPWSLVVDEVIPVSRWKEFGYDSPEAVAKDINNLKPAHYRCNAIKSNHLPGEKVRAEKKIFIPDGEW